MSEFDLFLCEDEQKIQPLEGRVVEPVFRARAQPPPPPPENGLFVPRTRVEPPQGDELQRVVGSFHSMAQLGVTELQEGLSDVLENVQQHTQHLKEFYLNQVKPEIYRAMSIRVQQPTKYTPEDVARLDKFHRDTEKKDQELKDLTRVLQNREVQLKLNETAFHERQRTATTQITQLETANAELRNRIREVEQQLSNDESGYKQQLLQQYETQLNAVNAAHREEILSLHQKFGENLEELSRRLGLQR